VQVILQHWTDRADLRMMFDAGPIISNAEAQMYDELHDEMMQL
jgi:hypothetical protein